MELAALIDALSDPAAYPGAPASVEVRQTHISVVFLVEGLVYKIKKPVALGFLDFSTLEKRRHFCEEEVRLNRRLAPHVYLGVAPVARTFRRIELEAAGEVVEWAVKMRRLPDEASLEARLERGEVDAATLQALAARIAEFHAGAEGGPRVASFGRFDVVARNARENLEQAAGHVGSALSRACLDRLSVLLEETLEKNRALIASRAERGVPRDTHGDLRTGHVYLFPECKPPDDVVVIDCIEFNERFRFGDPVADMAFLAMGLKFHGHRDLAGIFADAYFRTCKDDEGRALLPFYASYRAAVRGKVESIKADEPEIPPAERSRALAKARGYWLLALGELERPDRKPCLVLVAGLPGSGKSTLAADLAERAGFCVVRSDIVRKELAGGSAHERGPQGFGQGIYAPDWNQRTYDECLRLAQAFLFEGRRVIVDASFREDAPRQAFLRSAVDWGVIGMMMVCQAEPETIRHRLAGRRGDASDADWSIYEQAAESWQPPGPRARNAWRSVGSEGSRADTIERALKVLREENLF